MYPDNPDACFPPLSSGQNIARSCALPPYEPETRTFSTGKSGFRSRQPLLHGIVYGNPTYKPVVAGLFEKLPQQQRSSRSHRRNACFVQRSLQHDFEIMFPFSCHSLHCRLIEGPMGLPMLQVGPAGPDGFRNPMMGNPNREIPPLRLHPIGDHKPVHPFPPPMDTHEVPKSLVIWAGNNGSWFFQLRIAVKSCPSEGNPSSGEKIVGFGTP